MKSIYQNFVLIALVGMATACSNPTTTTTTEVATAVTVEDLKTSSIEKVINTTGTLLSTKTTSLNTLMAGKYKLLINPRTRRPFALGDVVEAGQTVIEMDDAEYVLGIGLETQKLNLDIAQKNNEKQQSLFEKGGVTELDIRNSEVSYLNAKSSLEKANLQLAKMQVKAPFKGVITDLTYVTNGTQVSSGTAAVTLMDYSVMTIDVNLPEKYINEVKIDQPVRIMNYTLPDDTLHGVIKELSPAVSSETRTFKGVISVDNSALKLRPGMFAKADIVLDSHVGVIVISKGIIVSNQRGKSVFVVDNGTAVEKRISIGFDTQTQAEVLTGLQVGDKVVVKGFETLRSRSKVKIVQ